MLGKTATHTPLELISKLNRPGWHGCRAIARSQAGELELELKTTKIQKGMSRCENARWWEAGVVVPQIIDWAQGAVFLWVCDPNRQLWRNIGEDESVGVAVYRDLNVAGRNVSVHKLCTWVRAARVQPEIDGTVRDDLCIVINAASKDPRRFLGPGLYECLVRVTVALEADLGGGALRVRRASLHGRQE
jgi:hypothetical protein